MCRIDREEISRGLALEESFRTIANRIGRAPSTVSREVNANGGRDAYRAVDAVLRRWARGWPSNNGLCRYAGAIRRLARLEPANRGQFAFLHRSRWTDRVGNWLLARLGRLVLHVADGVLRESTQFLGRVESRGVVEDDLVRVIGVGVPLRSVALTDNYQEIPGQGRIFLTVDARFVACAGSRSSGSEKHMPWSEGWWLSLVGPAMLLNGTPDRPGRCAGTPRTVRWPRHGRISFSCEWCSRQGRLVLHRSGLRRS